MLHSPRQAGLFDTIQPQPPTTQQTMNYIKSPNRQLSTLGVDDLPAICHAAKAHTNFRIILTAPAIMLACFTLFLAIHFLHRSVLATLILILPLPLLIRHDYEAFLALGPGGTPSTFLGYLKITCLRLITLSDPFTPPVIDGPITPAKGYFDHHQSTLPTRDGLRPTVAGIAPQRQLDQPGEKNAYLALRKSLENVAKTYSARTRTDTSCFEKQGLALFAIYPLNATCRGEICHVHHSDRSLHLNLHPSDAAVVLEKGWGERHPLAECCFGGGFVPRTFTMVYAPRNQEELASILKIIEAAAWWVSGETYEMIAQ